MANVTLNTGIEKMVNVNQAYDGYFGETIKDAHITNGIVPFTGNYLVTYYKAPSLEEGASLFKPFSVWTHDGVFHPDEVFALALLNAFELRTKTTRTRDPKKVTSCDFTIDVGGEYKPSERKFDHHQWREGDALYGKSSFGLIATMVEGASEKFWYLVAAIDARDTRVGYEAYEGGWADKIAENISGLNALDIQSKGQEIQFFRAVGYARNILEVIFEESDGDFQKAVEELENAATRNREEKGKVMATRIKSATPTYQLGLGIFLETNEYIGLQDLPEEVNGVIFYDSQTGETKLSVKTDRVKIVQAPKSKFVHPNGFFAVWDGEIFLNLPQILRKV